MESVRLKGVVRRAGEERDRVDGWREGVSVR